MAISSMIMVAEKEVAMADDLATQVEFAALKLAVGAIAGALAASFDPRLNKDPKQMRRFLDGLRDSAISGAKPAVSGSSTERDAVVARIEQSIRGIFDGVSTDWDPDPKSRLKVVK